MIDTKDAAGYLISLSFKDGRGYSLTAGKIQKLLYLAQGWSLLWEGMPLLKGPVGSGPAGPSDPSIFRLYGKYKGKPIPEEEAPDDWVVIPPGDKKTLEAVWKGYAPLSTPELTVMIDRMKAERKVYPDYRVEQNRNRTEHFEGLELESRQYGTGMPGFLSTVAKGEDNG